MIATAEARDDEMRERIAAHRSERPAGVAHDRGAGRRSPAALAALAEDEFAIVDCLSLWVSNLLERSARGGDRAARRRGGRRSLPRTRAAASRSRTRSAWASCPWTPSPAPTATCSAA